MNTRTYTTGRTYGKPQVLTITIESTTESECGFFKDIEATFIDDARSISGKVKVIVFSDSEINKAVLEEYDSGRYEALCYSNK